MKQAIKIGLSFLLTVGLLALLINQIGYQQLLDLFKQFTWKFAAVGFICYLASYFLRCWRWRYFFPGIDINLIDLFSLTSLTIVSQNILPGGSGEVSFVLILKKIFKISYSRGIVAMIVARLFDLLAMLLVFAIALLLLLKEKEISLVWLFVVGGIIVTLIMMISGMARMTGVMLKISNKLSRRYPKMAVVAEKLGSFRDGIRQLEQSNVYSKVFGVSLANQVVRFVAFKYMIEAIINRPFSLLSTIYGSTFSEISSKIPIHGVLGLGTYEGSWVGAQIMMGMNKQEAVLSAFGLHAVLLIFSAIMGGTGLTLMFFRKREWRNETGQP